MNVKLVQWALFTMFVFAPHSTAFGADCDSVLIPTREQAQSNHAVALSYLKLIDSSEYENLKHHGDAAASIPIVKGLVEASAKYDDFLENRKAYFEKTQFSYSEQEAQSTLKSYLPDTAISAWLTCKTGINGIALAAHSVLKNSFVLLLQWRPPLGVEKAVATLKIEGGTIDGKSSIEMPLPGPTDFSRTVKRVPRNGNVTVTVNAGGHSSDLLVQPVIPVNLQKLPAPDVLLGTSQDTARLAVFQFAEKKELIIRKVVAANCGGGGEILYTNSRNRPEHNSLVKPQTPPIPANTSYTLHKELHVPASEVELMWFNCNQSKFYGTVSPSLQ